MTITSEIPDSIAGKLFPDGSDAARKLLEDTVAQAYREGRLTKQEVRDALGMTWRLDIDPFLHRYGIFEYTVEDFEKDGEALASFRKARVAA